MPVIAIVQARMSSTRLPGKVLAEVQGRSVIGHILARVARAERVDAVAVATSVNPADDALAAHVLELGVPVHRGDENDVLARYHGAAEEFGADVILRVTADDPMKDPGVIDRGLGLLLERGLDFVHNCQPPSYPEGLDVEAFTRRALDAAAAEATTPFEREHVTPFFYANPGRFPQERFGLGGDLSSLRWTLDTAADLEFVRAVYDALYPHNPEFSMADVLDLLAERPELSQINSNVARSHHYRRAR